MADVTQLFATTISNYKKTMEINLRKSTEFLALLQKKSLKTSYNGGTDIVQPLMYGLNDTLQPYTMYDKMNIKQQTGFTQAKFPWKLHNISVSITKEEKLKNNGQAQIVSLVRSLITQAEISIKKGINSYLNAPGTGVSTVNGTRFPLHGIPAIVSDNPTTNPLPAGYDIVCDVRLGNIDRTLPENDWWRNKVYDASTWVAGDYQTKLIGAMDDLWYSTRDGSDTIDLILASPFFYRYYSDLVRDKQRVTSKEMADLGFYDVITYQGKPFVLEQDIADSPTTARAYFLNLKYLEFVIHPQDNFSVEPFVYVPEQKAEVSGIGFTGQLIVSNCQRQGVIFGVK